MTDNKSRTPVFNNQMIGVPFCLIDFDACLIGEGCDFAVFYRHM